MQCNASDSQCQLHQVPTTSEEEEGRGSRMQTHISISIPQMMNMHMHMHVKMKMKIFFFSPLRCLLLIPTHNTHEVCTYIYELMTITTFRRIQEAQQTSSSSSSSSNAGIPRSEFEHFVGQASSGCSVLKGASKSEY